MTRRNELLKALETTPHDLSRTLQGINPTTRFHPPDHWSIPDVINHLISIEGRSLACLQRVTYENNPTISFILPAPEHHDLTLPLETLLQRFTESRAQTLAFLHPLSSGVWARKATREDGRTTTFRYLVQNLVDHDTEHLNQIIEIKAR